MTTDPIAAARALIAAQPDLLFRCDLCPDEFNCHPHHDMSMSGEYILCDHCEDFNNPKGVPDPLTLIATLADALEAERAKVAAAYEAAAELVALVHVGDAIRALAASDAQAALDKLLAEARRAEQERCVEAVKTARDQQRQAWLEGRAVALDFARVVIAAIRALPEPKEDSHE